MLTKEQLTAKLKNVPLKFPYADYDYLRSFDSVEVRYAIGNDAVTDAIAEKYNIPEDHLPELAVARWAAAQYVLIRMKKRGISQADASNISGIGPTLFSKYAAGERPFTPLPSMLPNFCYKVMEESCHKVMFGEEGEILLPSFYASVVKHLLRASESENKELLKKANEIYRKYAAEPASIELVRERILQYCYEKGLKFGNFFGEDPHRQVENRLYYLFKEESPAALKLPYLMFMSFESGQALDFYISPDCISWVPTYYMDSDVKRELTDKTVRTIVSRCFAMQEQGRMEFLPYVLKGTFDVLL